MTNKFGKFFGNLKDYILNAKSDEKNRKRLIIGISLAINLVIFVAGYFIISYAFFMPVSAFNTDDVVVNIPRGSSIAKIAEDLKEAGLVRNSTVFRYYVDFTDKTSEIRSGTYTLNKTMSLEEITKELTKGGESSSEVKVTITEGMSVDDIAKSLSDKGVISDEESFKKECNNIDNYVKYDFIAAIADSTAGRRYALEGYLFPDTYMFYVNSSDEEVVNKLLSRFNEVFIPEWSERAQELNMTVDQIVILASIIEKESNTADFGKVSAVLYGRLDEGITLGMDSTVQYASDISRLALTQEDISVNSPYNTYVNKGLPPSAISNPGERALNFALYPDEAFMDEGYLYFCNAEPTASNLVFSKTLEEHNANVEKYRPLWEEYDKENAQ